MCSDAAPRPAGSRGVPAALHRYALRALLGLVALQACTPSPPDRVLVVGIDGASSEVLEPLLDSGRLPSLQAIAERGAHGPLRSIPPLLSPPLWTSIATGKSRDEHGILSFAHSGEGGSPRLYRSTDRRVHALWNIVSAAGLSVGVVNWWNTFPVEKVAGVMVSDAFFPDEIAGRELLIGLEESTNESPEGAPTVYPPELAPRLREAASRASVEPDVSAALSHPDLPPWIDHQALIDVYERDAAIVELALATEDEIEPEVLMLLLPGIDRLSHWLWGAIAEPSDLPPELRFSEDQRRAGRSALELYYAQTDRWIGRLLTRFGAEDLVLVLSDHGFEAGQRLLALTGAHESEEAELAVLFARGRGIDGATGTEGTTILDLTPAILAWLGLPVAEDMEGRVPPFVDAVPAEAIPTYDTGRIERLPVSRTAGDEVLLEELRSLGYLE